MARSETISQESLIGLERAGSIRSLRAVRSGDGAWRLVAQIGLDERTLRSQRADARTWRSLDSLERSAREEIGIGCFEVHAL